MSTRSLPLRSLVCAGLLALAAGCSNPAGPVVIPPPVAGPSISCPADVTSDVDRTPSTISYTPPIVTGGVAPVATACTIASGATFPSGTSDIICTATDAQQRTAQCVFHVNVNVTTRLQGVTFLAFGDSLTDGEVAASVTKVLDVQRENSYPTVLQALLRAQYTAQAKDIVVINGGESGKNAGNDEDRLPGLVNSNNPSAVLLLEGVNDVNKGISPDTILQSLRADIARSYRNSSVKKVFISTLLPQIPGRFRAFNPDGVVEMNDLIRAAAPGNQAVLVDAYAALYPQRELLIGDDGLHPTVQGYKVLAETFRAAISQAFEVPPLAPASILLFRPGAVRAGPTSNLRPRVPR